MSLITIPADLWQYPTLGSALVALIDKAASASEAGYTAAELRDLSVEAAATFVAVVKGYSDLTGEQKAALVDQALQAFLSHLAPLVTEGAKAVIAMALPWYLRWVPWILSALIQIDVVDLLIAQVPVIRQSVYETLKKTWHLS